MILIGILLASQFAHATKTYSPAQLKKMVNSGKYPAQGSPTTQTVDASFYACNSKVKQVINDIGDNYPIQKIVDTEIIKVTKVWTNDGAITLSCSKLDEKLVITISKYL